MLHMLTKHVNELVTIDVHVRRMNAKPLPTCDVIRQIITETVNKVQVKNSIFSYEPIGLSLEPTT